jgi:hypothetical protein
VCGISACVTWSPILSDCLTTAWRQCWPWDEGKNDLLMLKHVLEKCSEIPVATRDFAKVWWKERCIGYISLYKVCLLYYNVNKIGNALINVVTVWGIRLTISQWKNSNSSCVCVCVVELQVTLSYINILSIAQKCFHGKFMSPAAIQIIKTILNGIISN